MRVMAVDYGDARTGVAISDPTGLLAGFTTVIQSHNSDFVAREIAKLVQTHGVEELIMGFPRNMDGTEGPRAALYRAFAAQLEEITGLPFGVPVPQSAEVIDSYRGGGWGKNTPESEQEIFTFARSEGIFIENVYNSKVLVGMRDQIHNGKIQGTVCFLHSGGLGSLFAQY